MSVKREDEEFLSVLEKNKRIIYKVVNSYCKNNDDRDDLIQEITIHLWESWPKYNSDYKISTWMYMISLNVAISFYRKTYRIDTNKTELNSEIESDNNEEDISKSDNINALYQYIDELNEINKALMLLYLDQYNYKEIAYALGISETNVATKISRIKEQLKKRFK